MPGLGGAECTYASSFHSVHRSLGLCSPLRESLGAQACADDEAGAVAGGGHSIDPQGEATDGAVVYMESATHLSLRLAWHSATEGLSVLLNLSQWNATGL